jgi:flagellar motor switch protein FliG
VTTDAAAGEGLYKSAVLLISMGTDLAARVLSLMDERSVEALIGEMTRLGPLRSSQCEWVADEFALRMAEDSGAMGGPAYSRRLLEQAWGPERAGRMMDQISPAETGPPSLETILATTSPQSLAALMADEHPQIIALLVGQLSVEKAAEMLAALPADLQGSVAARLAGMEEPAPLALEHLERYLVEKLHREPGEGGKTVGAGPQRVADILSRMRRSLENLILASIEQHSPILAQRVNRYRFTFENLLEVEGRVLQRVLRDIEADTLRLAMKGLAEEQQQVIYANMSERAAARLMEDLQSSGPAQLREVETAQQIMVATARALRDSGEVQFPIGGEEEEEEGHSA